MGHRGDAGTGGSDGSRKRPDRRACGAALERVQKQTSGAKLRGVAADLGTAKGVAEMTRAVPDTDILVNNLGTYAVKPFAEITDADWMNIFEVNVMSGVRLSGHYLPGMLRRNWGRVIFISSESGQQIPAEMVHYGVTRTAQLAVARGLAETVAGTGVTVNSVMPGPTASEGVTGFVTEIARKRGLSPAEVEKEFFKSIRPSSLLKRFETPEEIAAVVAFVASPRSAAISGAAVRADGGVARSIL
ncbi:MAG TPA: SDR family oxidoreductase [Candidatus Acidoferrales bacterium]|nr:SDR family oxidoreductase [Candidatus Acidoferrales bacterium]